MLDFQSWRRDCISPVRNCDLWSFAELKSHHIGGDFLLLRLQCQDSSVDQGLNSILEDIALVSRMVDHPVVEAVFRVVCAPYLIGTPSIWQPHFVPFVEQMKYRDHLIVFEGVLLRRELGLLIVEATLLGLRLHISG